MFIDRRCAMRAVRNFAGAGVAALFGLGAQQAPAASAPLPADPLGTVATLPAASPHWLWVNDVVFSHMSDGQALLIDGDTGHFLGMLSTGFGFNRIVLPRDGKVIFSPETYFSRGTRGERTDVVTLYDPLTLRPLEEISIPAKRSSNLPMMANSELTDDDRFLLIYNFNPAQSVTVIDARAHKFVGELETPGCALVYPTGPRSFFSICADGALLDVQLDDIGHAVRQQRTGAVFDVATDPVTEKGVRVGNSWIFVSFGGTFYPVTITANGLVAGARWSLLNATERAQNWRPGGVQQLAVHAGLNRIYSIMHQGPIGSHKDPGKEVWVYDLARKTRLQRIALKNVASSIQTTRDSKPLLFAAFMDSTTTDVYDAETGEHKRAIENIGTTPTLLVTP